ncbi:3-deoxy-manno-octulosonate cytidylyltransferase [Methylocystis heyeri]|uniref:3-deoxy-manno-octulosonate cytidylyltransferase n=1 Tax=Methylocystis heyeri TaxID=391905 RepID=UPI0011348480
MTPIIVIPARIGSTRLPGKALAAIAGKPMIAHVLERGLEAGIGPVAVATDSPEIAAAVETAGGRAVMTFETHACGLDRIGEALRAVDPGRRHDVVVDLQGDQPFLPQGALQAAVELLQDPAVDMATLATEAAVGEEDDPDTPKLVGSEISPRRLRALYFTRARAPWGEGVFYHHIGVYAFRRPAFERFVALPPSALEKRERLEQLRALEAGMRIDAALLDRAGPSVDTETDLEAARRTAPGKQDRR